MEAITRPAVPAASTKTGEGGWVASTYRGGYGHQAVAASIRVVREKIEAGQALVAVEYDDTDGRRWFYVYGAREHADGNWKVSGGSGGSAEGPAAPRSPWANLGGWGNDSLTCAGGRVHGEGVHRVRLRGSTGQSFEDEVQSDVALLIGDCPFGGRYTVELLDRSGAVLGTHHWGHDRQS